MMNGKPAISDHEARSIHFSFYQRQVGIRLDRLKRPKRRGYAANSPDADDAKLSVSILQSPGSENERIAWQDDEQGKVETRITEIAIQIILTAELQYREGTMRSHEWRVQRKAELEEEEREKKLQAERAERKRQKRLEQARIDRLLKSAAAFEQSGSTLKQFVRHRLTIRLAQGKSWNVGANGYWRKRTGLILWSGVDSCWPCETNSNRKIGVLTLFGKTEGTHFVYDLFMRGGSNGKNEAARS
jgi:hypothetical protein